MGDLLEASILELILNGVGIPGIADDTATSPLANLYVSLHTSDPGTSGDQTAEEISYTGYARVAVARSAGSPAWTISGAQPSAAIPNASIVFGTMSGGDGGTAQYAVVGTLSTGAGQILYKGAITPNIFVISGVAPSLLVSSAISQL